MESTEIAGCHRGKEGHPLGSVNCPVHGLIYVVVSEYAGEQGHLGGGDVREHERFPEPSAAFEWIKVNRANHHLDYRRVRVEVRRKS